MFKYRIDVIESLRNAGFKPQLIRNKRILSQSSLTKFRNNDTNLTLDTVSILLSLLECGFDDVFEFIPDDLDCIDRTKQS